MSVLLCFLLMGQWSSDDVSLIKSIMLAPLPDDPTNRFSQRDDVAAFGQRLFFEAGLSGDKTTSCSSCHVPQNAFTDGRVTPPQRPRNTPTLINAAYQTWFYWDGRRDSLWSQALEPIRHPLEMGSNDQQLAMRVREDPCLRRDYLSLFAAFPNDDADGVTRVVVNLAKSIAAYEMRLVSESSAFDRFAQALARGTATPPSGEFNRAAREGLRLFIGRAGCIRCHNGPALSDGQFHRLGVPDQQDPARIIDAGRDAGVREVVKTPLNAASRWSDASMSYRARRLDLLQPLDSDWAAFRTPSLRNVALTAPYMHNGSLSTLHDVLTFYNTRRQAVSLDHHTDPLLIPLDLNADEIDALIAFLKSLNGAPPARWTRRPTDPCDPARNSQH